MRIFLSLCLVAWTFGSAEATKYAGETFSAGVGARALGMGAAGTALPGDVTSGYWNPAALTEINGSEFMLMHSERFAGLVRYDYAAFARPLLSSTVEAPNGRPHALGLYVVRQGVDDIPETRLVDPDMPAVYIDEETGALVTNYETLGMGSDAEYLVGLSYGTRFSRGPAIGATLKALYKGVLGHSAFGVGVDLSVAGTVGGGFRLGATIRDLTLTPIVWDTGTRETIFPSLRTGLAWERDLGGARSILLAGDAQFLIEGRETASQLWLGAETSLDFGVGAEIRLADSVALRAGLDTGRLSAGGTLSFGPVDVDYAFRSQADLDDTHRVGIRYGGAR